MRPRRSANEERDEIVAAVTSSLAGPSRAGLGNGEARHPRRLKVALVVSHLRGGGTEQCVVDLGNAVAGNQFEPLIVCLGPAGPLEDRIRHGSVKLVVLNKRPGNDLMLPFRLGNLLKREGADVVHSNNWGALMESVLAARWAGVRAVVHTQHGLDYGLGASRSGPGSLRTLVKRIAGRGIRRIAAVSREVQEVVTREWHVPAEKVALIHNGVSLNCRPMAHEERVRGRLRLGLTEDDFVVGSVGIFRPVKNFPILVEAMAGVVAHSPRARLVLVGDGPSRAEIEAVVDRVGLRSFVRFLGMRSDVSALLPLMDLFVLCSLSEGISLSVLEAMAAGLAVVATRVGGNPEIVQEGQTGFLVPSGSAAEATKAILALSDRPALRSSMGLCGRERVQTHFSVERMARDYETLYAAVVG